MRDPALTELLRSTRALPGNLSQWAEQTIGLCEDYPQDKREILRDAEARAAKFIARIRGDEGLEAAMTEVSLWKAHGVTDTDLEAIRAAYAKASRSMEAVG